MKLLLIALLFSINANAQDLKLLEQLEDHYQVCLDSGTDMKGCAQRYYFTMDSMLNVVYNSLRQGLDSAAKISLRNEQRKWLDKRDKYFATVAKEPLDGGLTGEDREMIVLDKKAAFVQKRVMELIKKLNNLPLPEVKEG